MLKPRILACLVTLSPIAATAAAAIAQTDPDYAAIVAAPDRSDADRKLDTNRAPAQLLAFIGAKPGMKILDIFAVYGWKAELLARAVAPGGKVYAQNSEAGFARVKDRLDARLQTPAAANIVSVVRPLEDPAPPDMHDFDLAEDRVGHTSGEGRDFGNQEVVLAHSWPGSMKSRRKLHRFRQK